MNRRFPMEIIPFLNDNYSLVIEENPLKNQGINGMNTVWRSPGMNDIKSFPAPCQGDF